MLPVSSSARKQLESPVPAPSQLVAVGLNYHEHANEAGYASSEGLPPIFTKFSPSITGPCATVELPAGNIDWEVELGVVIGRTASPVDEADAWDYVTGLTIAQDLSDFHGSGVAPTGG
jgi:2-keto-4-pentenoate hydratase/2-oxohepta-3-ene-1,7-dioic acid hydratase in catechol pathway